MIDKRVAAIRANEKVGRGSCTTIDECFDDNDLIEALEEDQVYKADHAVMWALEYEGMIIEQGLNQRWGGDDDEQLIRWQEWQE